MTRQGAGRGGRLLGPLLAAAVLLLGCAVAVLSAGALRADDRAAAHRVMDQRTAVARSAVVTETARYLDLLRLVAAGVGSNGGLTAAAFQALAEPLARGHLLGATSVVFAVPTAGAEIASTQRTWRARGIPGLTLSPQGTASEHIFSIFNRALNRNPPSSLGVDVSQLPEVSSALQEARRTGAAAVSDTYVLLRDRGLPAQQRQLSFAFAAPVYGVAGAGVSQGPFRGWIIMGLRGQDFVGGVLGDAGQGLLDGELHAVNRDGRPVRVAANNADGTRDLRREATFPVANRHWTLITGADSANLPGARSNLPGTVLIGGITLALLLAWLVYVLATSRARARARVSIATAELRQAETEATRQAGLLAAIMASISDGVGVIDESGRFLLHNPAAKQLLGVGWDIDGPEGWQEHFGLFLPDGQTPFPSEEMPLVRALGGEASDGVEMIIRNPSRPDGILISVDGRPLDASAGLRGAVAVFHDITEMRRYEADLSVFAGVVAHDLKSPLAIIRGHCETAVEMLTVRLTPESLDEARAALTRIARAVDRMAALIDTLLAYTTARDAPLRLQRVALAPLVADVVSERTGHRRPADGPGPDIYIGSLPAATADPAMLRHVIDNLIGNAIKYVPPGRLPRVDITAGNSEPGWVRVEVADRGIGIPDDDKPRIFESFHRAHPDGGYAGTGLGLAICRRIVERHGGNIGVGDNPGGGTRFHFTLPGGSRPDPPGAHDAPSGTAPAAPGASTAPAAPGPTASPPAAIARPVAGRRG